MTFTGLDNGVHLSSFTYVPNANFSGTDTFTYTTTDVRYRIVPLGTLGGNSSFALDVNNNRQVTGNSNRTGVTGNPLQAYRWQNGVFTPLGVLTGTGSNNFSRGYALNDHGDVVGESDNNTSLAFVYQDDAMAGLTRLAGDNFRGVAHDINPSDVIVGISSNGTVSRPTIWTFDGTKFVAADLGTISGTATSTGRAWAINDHGLIAGLSHNSSGVSQATLWNGATITNLTSLGDGTLFSQAFGLNRNGLVVGSSSTGQTVGQLIGTTSTTGITRAFAWESGSMVELLPYNFYAPGNTGSTTNYHSVANDVNDSGVVVGNSQRISGSAAIATMWVAGAAMDLNALVPVGSGWTLRSAEGINGSGDIVGFGTNAGQTRAFLLVPELVTPDGSPYSNTATVTITVAGTADPPDAVNDSFVVLPGNFAQGNVLFNDYEPDGDPMTSTLTAPSTHGTVTLNTNGTFVYTPGASFAGTDSFTYTVSDGLGGTDTATATISAAVMNRPFVATLKTGHADIGLALGSHDDGHGHSHGSSSPEWDLDVHDEGEDEEYTPAQALLYVGPDAETSRPEDSVFDFIGVGPGESYFRLPQTENPNLLYLGIAAEEIEDGTLLGGSARLRLKYVNGPGHFSLWSSTDSGPDVKMATSNGVTEDDFVTILEGGHAHFNYGFTATGRYEVTFQAIGFLAGCEEVISNDVTFYFHVAPVAHHDAYVVAKNGHLFGNVVFNDIVSSGPLTAATTTNPTFGTVTVQPNGAFEYVPGPSFSSSDSFTYTVTDQYGQSDMATVAIGSSGLPDFAAVLTEGHADLGLALGEHDHGDDGDHEDPEWDLHVHDDENGQEYHPDEVLLYVGMDGITNRPAGAEFDFIGVNAGKSYFRLPQTETVELLFLGIGAEEIEDGTLLGGSAKLRLKSVNGPGHFSLWSSTDTGPDVMMATADGITESDFVTVLEGGHAHVNFGFTEMGIYCVTFQAIGTLADGDEILSDDVTYFFKVGNTAEAIDVQNGMAQRSYVRHLDVLFGSDDGLDDILANPGRLHLLKHDLDGNNPTTVPATSYSLSTLGNRLKLDFGSQGLGGNRNSNLGDGYYRVGVDVDGDGDFETYKSFYRLFGDVGNPVGGPMMVTDADVDLVSLALGRVGSSLEEDTNGDGVVNALDRLYTMRARGRRLKDGLSLDD